MLDAFRRVAGCHTNTDTAFDLYPSADLLRGITGTGGAHPTDSIKVRGHEGAYAQLACCNRSLAACGPQRAQQLANAASCYAQAARGPGAHPTVMSVTIMNQRVAGMEEKLLSTSWLALTLGYADSGVPMRSASALSK
jgi:hypothetical protein